MTLICVSVFLLNNVFHPGGSLMNVFSSFVNKTLYYNIEHVFEKGRDNTQDC